MTIRKGLRQAYMFKVFMILTVVMMTVISFGNETALASVTQSQMFDLDDPSDPLFTSKALTDSTVLQSFAIDNTNNYIYTVQVTAGGQQLANETRTYTGAERTLNGDLTVTKLNLTGGVAGKMYLKGFGHGVSIGVEPVGTTAYLWSEVDAVNDTTDSDGGLTGWGTQLGRFKFENNKVLVKTDSTITKYSPLSGVDRTTVNIDMANGTLTMRYRTGGAAGSFHYKVYNLAQFKANTFTALATVDQPSNVGTFQGFVTYGSYLYLLEGNAYSDTNPSPTGNTYISIINLNTGIQVERTWTGAGKSLLYREPEGMSIQITGTTVKLCFGFASYKSSTDTGKNANIFFKDALVTGI